MYPYIVYIPSEHGEYKVMASALDSTSQALIDSKSQDAHRLDIISALTNMHKFQGGWVKDTFVNFWCRGRMASISDYSYS